MSSGEAPIKFDVTEYDDFCLIEFELTRDLNASDLANIKAPDAVKGGFASKGIIISGRGPIWLYCYLAHFYHPTKFVATFDPRLGGAVVIQSHSLDFKVGDVIYLNE